MNSRRVVIDRLSNCMKGFLDSETVHIVAIQDCLTSRANWNNCSPWKSKSNWINDRKSVLSKCCYSYLQQENSSRYASEALDPGSATSGSKWCTQSQARWSRSGLRSLTSCVDHNLFTTQFVSDVLGGLLPRTVVKSTARFRRFPKVPLVTENNSAVPNSKPLHHSPYGSNRSDSFVIAFTCLNPVMQEIEGQPTTPTLLLITVTSEGRGPPASGVVEGETSLI